MGLPDCQSGLFLTGAFCLLRLPLPPPEPGSQGPASDLEIWQADSTGEYGVPGELPSTGRGRDLATVQAFRVCAKRGTFLGHAGNMGGSNDPYTWM